MTAKPQNIKEYDFERNKLVRSTCLDLATRVGDLIDDLVIVGGMVPGLIISQDNLTNEAEPHCGTMDIDLGLAVALFDNRRYQDLPDRLKSAGFEPDKNGSGNITRQRWRVVDDHSLTIDFLVGPSGPNEQQSAGKLRSIEDDFAAIIVPGLEMAFLDALSVQLQGDTRRGESAKSDISVCGPAAFIALKALAFGNRGENKDAYDLFYVMRNYGDGIADVVARFDVLRGDENLNKALAIIEENFTAETSTGAMRVSNFIHGGVNYDTIADVVGFARELLVGLKQ